ncbi:Transposable element Tcb2 transposase [Ceratobasidium sp. AG-Ba]|nr:Transposable element Tcb2 transposase [Ceratobasidium sp. AG-Ba]
MVRRRIKDEGLECFQRQEVPYLTPVHVKLHLEWGIEHLFCTPENWATVIFSDTSKFNVFGSDGNRKCWQKRGKGLNPHYTQKKVPPGGDSVMVWGCVIQHGVSKLHRISIRMTSAGYIKVLAEELLGTLHDHHISLHSIYFQHDRDRKQWTKLVEDFLEEHHVGSLPWPASSPNMNIIENLWDQLDCQVHACVPKAITANELWCNLQDEWYGMDQKYIDHLYQSLPTRVQKLLDTKGGNTEF